jgi:hypothetical protein
MTWYNVITPKGVDVAHPAGLDEPVLSYVV